MLTVIIILIICLIVIMMANTMSNKTDRTSIGLNNRHVVSMDGSREYVGKTLYSMLLPIYGRPDRILVDKDSIIPVEEKPASTKLYPSHIIQLYTYCQLVEENYKIPPYGIVRLKGGEEVKVPWDEGAKQRLGDIVLKAAKVLQGKVSPNGTQGAKCRNCGFKNACLGRGSSVLPCSAGRNASINASTTMGL